MLVRLPRILIGVILSLYWARVLYMTRKFKRVAGHSANLIPVQKIDRLTRLIWFPVVGFWIGLPLAMGVGKVRSTAFRPIYNQPVVVWISLGAAAAAWVATLVCWKAMGKSWRMGIDPNEKTNLVVKGPYARVRHPIYALSSVLMAATAVGCPSPMMFCVAAVHLGLLQFEARREERYLRRVHGEEYERYLRGTGRFWPRKHWGARKSPG